MKKDYLTLKTLLVIRDALHSCKSYTAGGQTFDKQAVFDAQKALANLENALETEDKELLKKCGK